MAQHNVSRDSDYAIAITGRHFEVTQAVESYVSGKILSVAKIAPRVVDVAVILDAHKLEHSCAIVMSLPHHTIHVHASTENMYAAIDKCTDKLFALVTKYKSKLQSKHGEPLSSVDFEVNVIKPYNDNLKLINEDIEEVTSLKDAARFQLHEVVAKESVSIKVHTQEEAVMRMEFSNDPFMIYRSEEDQKIKILYRRPDNNYNLVQVT
jgi:putative sigma-54 modulation protein